MNFVDNDWQEALKEEFSKEYFKKIEAALSEEYSKNITIYPPKEDIFNAFKYTPLHNVKCVIIGQDPYHEEGEAHGLCFSVKPQIKIPPSLRNIYKELKDDLDFDIPDNGYLEKWARQGVFMLNAVLTVREHEADSHKNIGWSKFTDAVINVLNKEDRPIVFILWGGNARKKKKLLDNPKHLILEANHPSPLSANRGGFFGTKPFSKTNDFLISHGVQAIDWKIDNMQ